MPSFRIFASAAAVMRASTTIEADTPEAAEAAAKVFFESGDADWKYDGIIEDSSHDIEIERVELV
jgi:hypothetical protein